MKFRQKPKQPKVLHSCDSSAFGVAVCQIQMFFLFCFVFPNQNDAYAFFVLRCNTSKHQNPFRRPEDIKSSSRQNIQVSYVV